MVSVDLLCFPTDTLTHLVPPPRVEPPAPSSSAPSVAYTIEDLPHPIAPSYFLPDRQAGNGTER